MSDAALLGLFVFVLFLLAWAACRPASYRRPFDQERD